MSKIVKTFKVDGVKTNMTSVKLSNYAATYGVKRNDTDAVVVNDGTAMTNLGTGVYEYEFTDPADDLTYSYSLEYVYGGETYWINDTLTGPTSFTGLATLADTLEYLGDPSDDDDLITDLLTAATNVIENYCQKHFKSASYSKWLDGSGQQKLYLPEWPITAVGMLSLSPVDGVAVQSGDTSASHASVAVNSTGVTLLLSDGDNAATTTVDFATYTTLATLTAQIEATAGTWTTEVADAYTGYRSAKLRALPAQFCLDNAAYLTMPGDPESGFFFDEGEGYLMLNSGGFTRGSRNIYVEWTAGYSTVPASVQQVCKELTAWMYHYAKREDTTLKSFTVDAVSWTAAAQQDGRQNVLTLDQRHRLSPYRGMLE